MSELNWLVIEMLLAQTLVQMCRATVERKEGDTAFSLQQQRAVSADSSWGMAVYP